MAGAMEERGRLPGPTALAAGAPSRSCGENENSVSWFLRKNPPTIRPDPNTLSTVVVIETTLPQRSTMVRWVVPETYLVASGARTHAPFGLPGATAAAGRGPISLARSAR